jgi:transcription termination/antitermination protein NusA
MFSWLRSAAKPAQAQTPAAQDDPERSKAALDAKRRELGVEDALQAIPGVTAAMLVAFGESGIKTLQELAECAVDDLHGWVESKGDSSKSHPGVLSGFGLTREQCGAMIITARIKLGWIDESAAQPTKQPS